MVRCLGVSWNAPGVHSRARPLGGQNMNRPRERLWALLSTLWACGWACSSAAGVGGRVADLNNQGLPGAMVTLTKAPQAPGPTAMTVFSDEHGAFVFPATAPQGTLSVR